MPDHSGAARVGRHHSAERCRLARREIDAEPETHTRRPRIECRKRHPCLHADAATDRVDLVDVGHTCGRQHNRRSRGIGGRDRPADKPGIAALRTDRDTFVGAQPDDRGHLLGGAGSDNRDGAAGPATCPVGEVTRHRIGVAEDVRRPDDVAESAEGVESATHWITEVRGHHPIMLA